jgi:peptide/nickel transport system permease protein
MLKYAIHRLLLMVPSVIGVTMLTFIGLRVLMPSDVVDQLLANYGSDDPEVRAALANELGLTGSLPGQYLRWAGVSWFFGGDTGVLEGDFGESLLTGRDVLSEIRHRAPVSFELGMIGQTMAIMIAVPVGVWAARKQDKWPDYGLRSIAILVNSLPGFWVAVLIITFGQVWFNWAPPINFKYLTEDPIAHLEIIALPALIIGLTPTGSLVRLVRTQMLEVLRQDYVRTAQGKGLSQSTVVYRHALRNALLPIVTVVGIGLPNIIAGTVIFEEIFLIPGMGRYLVDAVDGLDYPVILGLNLVFAILLMVSALVVDLTYALLDPRVQYS